MKQNKTLRLLAASWLIAPTVLAAHPVLAEGQTPQSSNVGVIKDSSTTKTTELPTTTSTEEGTTDTTQTPETATHTLFIDSQIVNKVQFKTLDGQILDASSGSLSDLAEGTQIAYTIQPAEGEAIVSVEIPGTDSFEPAKDQLSGTFTIGTQDATFEAVFQPIDSSSSTEDSSTSTTESSTEETTDSSTEPSTGETTDSSTNQSTEETTDSSKPSNNGNQGNSNHTGSSSGNSQQNNANNSTNTGQANRPNRPAASATPSNIGNSSDPLAVAGTDLSQAVIKTPIEATLPSNTTAVQKAIIQEAYRYLGTPYVWGAKGPNSFDCSGLTYYVYMKATGHNIGSWTGEQQYGGTQIPVSEAQPGDLLFWGPASGVTHHVGIYIGDGKFIHAPQPGESVRITSISDYTPDFAVRVNINGLPAVTGANASILDDMNQFHFSKNQTTDQFLTKVSEFAREIGQQKGIYASVMLAQAILESGSGNSLLASEPNYNLFGIKGSFEGNSVAFRTLEQDADGQSFQIRAQFRKYPSYKESLEDYAKLIKNGISGNKSFYKPAWKSEAKTYHEATEYLQGRYATDKQYAQKLNAIIKAYDLTQYDQPKENKTTTRTFTAPVRWSRQQNNFFDVDLTRSSFLSSFSGFKIASIWDIFYHFTIKQIPPRRQIIDLSVDQVPLSTMIWTNNWWRINL